MQRRSSLALAGMLVITCAACARQEPASAPARTTGAEDVPAVRVSPELAAACAIPDERAEQPRFDFDSARLHERGERIVRGVAACLMTGPLGDAEITIVGHTDPRGSARYNEQLGLYRAEAVRLALVALGVPPERLHLQSRGEADARGTDESTWQLDRVVEIRVGRPPAPTHE